MSSAYTFPMVRASLSHSFFYFSHWFSVYPPVWDKDVARKILEASLRHCGISLTSVKPDLYTAIGLDSKHPSKMGSSIWTSMALMNKETSLVGGTFSRRV
jgi:hypothetical protein